MWGNDLWVLYRQHTHDDFGWEPAFNLGCTINTSFDEDGPTYFEDEATAVTTLYFTSFNRLGNVGDWDIYASTLQADGTFGPGQLVPELCSIGRDTRTSISRNGLEMFITSNRTGGLGGLDLWVSVFVSLKRTKLVDVVQVDLSSAESRTATRCCFVVRILAPAIERR